MANAKNAKHNQWMKILTAVFSALANLFGSLKINKSKDAEASDSDILE